jgi:hypothetical protein
LEKAETFIFMGFAVLVRLGADPACKTPPIAIVRGEVTTIGRRGDVRMDTPSGREISRIHATISRHEGNHKEHWILEDNSSVNGTFINGRKIHVRVLASGDEILFGGGPNYKLGDLLDCTTFSPCRYAFFPVDPLVNFAPHMDPNSSKTEEKDVCAICYESIVAGEILLCGHTFCARCIGQWAEECRRCSRPSICPMCRNKFKRSELNACEFEMHDDRLEVSSLDPILNDLDMPSGRAVKAFNIFRKWTDEHKKWFWSAFSKLEQWHRRVIFLHLTKATVAHVFQASESDILQAIENLGIVSNSTDKEENRRLLILRILRDFQTHK